MVEEPEVSYLAVDNSYAEKVGNSWTIPNCQKQLIGKEKAAASISRRISMI